MNATSDLNYLCVESTLGMVRCEVRAERDEYDEMFEAVMTLRSDRDGKAFHTGPIGDLHPDRESCLAAVPTVLTRERGLKIIKTL